MLSQLSSTSDRCCVSAGTELMSSVTFLLSSADSCVVFFNTVTIVLALFSLKQIARDCQKYEYFLNYSFSSLNILIFILNFLFRRFFCCCMDQLITTKLWANSALLLIDAVFLLKLSWSLVSHSCSSRLFFCCQLGGISTPALNCKLCWTIPIFLLHLGSTAGTVNNSTRGIQGL